MDAKRTVAQLATKASQTLHAYTETNPIVFISHIIAPRHDTLQNNIKPMQKDLVVKPFARWLNSSVAPSRGAAKWMMLSVFSVLE